MFITKESDYAVRIIRHLSRGGREKVADICESEYIPLQYAYKIIKKLEKGGLVAGFRGIKGGYALARDAGEMSLFDVISAVEDDLLLNECLSHGFGCPMKGKGNKTCGVHREFARIQRLLLEHLREKSLAELF